MLWERKETKEVSPEIIPDYSIKEKWLIGFHQIENVWSLKQTIKKTKRQTTKWKKLFAKYVSNEGLVSAAY